MLRTAWGQNELEVQEGYYKLNREGGWDRIDASIDTYTQGNTEKASNLTQEEQTKRAYSKKSQLIESI